MGKANKKALLAAALDYYQTLDQQEAVNVEMLDTNLKIIKSNLNMKSHYILVGCSLFPAFMGSCSHFRDCAKLCVFNGGILQVGASNTFELTGKDKNGLKRLWLFNHAKEFFYRWLNMEIELASVKNGKEVLFRETTSECLDYSKLNCKTFSYFKNPAKIKRSNDYKLDLPIYSWSELSHQNHILDCIDNEIPVAVVVPAVGFNKLFEKAT